jgi:hypothetical protein
MRILITGSRSWPVEDIDKVENVILSVIQNSTKAGDVITFVVGDCPTGVDSFISKIALKVPMNRIVKEERYVAYWDKEGLSAGPKRNQRMVDSGADICLAFIQGNSRGTRNCAAKAERAGISVKWFNYNNL